MIFKLYAISDLVLIIKRDSEVLVIDKQNKSFTLGFDEFLKQWTKENNIKMPKANVSLDKSKVNRTVGSAGYLITLKDKENATEIVTLKRSLLGNMIMLHKAKAGLLFKIMMVLYGIVLAGFYISGITIATFKKNVNGKLVPKTENYIVIAAGLIVTIIFAIISL